MKMKKVISVVLVMVLFAFAVPMAVTPAAATYPYEKKIPGDADENNELTKDELVNAILPYMLDEGDLKLDDVGDAAHVHAYWDGKPKMVVDQADRTATFYRPVERVVSPSVDSTRVMIALDACDTLVGVYSPSRYSSSTRTLEAANACGGILSERPDIGSFSTAKLNYELILTIEPDVIVGGYGESKYIGTAAIIQERLEIPFVMVYGYGSGNSFDNLFRSIRTIGDLLEKETETEELCSLIEEKIDKVREVTSEIPEEEKPRVYIASRGSSRIRTHPLYAPIDIAGGINVAKDVPGASTATEVTVLKEQIVVWNPDIIVVSASGSGDPAADILLDPHLQTINAVKNHSVYNIIYPYSYGMPHHRNLANVMYMSKLFYPEKFKDLDVEKEGNEIYKLFYKVDGLFSEFADSTSWLREFLDNPPEEKEW